MTAHRARSGNKVPDPTPSFWVIKVLTTGMGEALSDFLVRRFDPAPTALVTAVLFAVALVVQFAVPRYHPWRYWTTVALVGVLGTMVADAVHVAADVPYVVTTPVFLAVLVTVFVVWRRTEGTIDVHDVTTPRREAFYWSAVVATFAMGTAAGDLVAATLHLGDLIAGIVFLAAIAVALLVRAGRVIGAVTAFWTAYVLTRPVGASFADWFASSPARGGLGMGTGLVSAISGIAIVYAVIASTRYRRATAAGPTADAESLSPPRPRAVRSRRAASPRHSRS